MSINEYCWDIQDQTFENGTLCQRCPYYEVKEESVPYGETHIGRTVYLCNVVDPCDCIGVFEHDLDCRDAVDESFWEEF